MKYSNDITITAANYQRRPLDASRVSGCASILNHLRITKLTKPYYIRAFLYFDQHLESGPGDQSMFSTSSYRLRRPTRLTLVSITILDARLASIAESKPPENTKRIYFCTDERRPHGDEKRYAKRTFSWMDGGGGFDDRLRDHRDEKRHAKWTFSWMDGGGLFESDRDTRKPLKT